MVQKLIQGIGLISVMRGLSFLGARWADHGVVQVVWDGEGSQAQGEPVSGCGFSIVCDLYRAFSSLLLSPAFFRLQDEVMPTFLQTFKVPSNLVLKKFTPSSYIAIITAIWGIIAT